MHFHYGELMPLRLLDEAMFWKHQEQEHTVVIRELVPNLEKKFVEELKEWEISFTKTHGQVIQLIKTVVRSGDPVPPAVTDQVMHLINFCLEQSKRFVQQLLEILKLSQAIQEVPTAITVIKHIIRESEYFIGIAQTICYQR
ncbi:MAG: hypothetical protein APF84_05250 [Gracilibacter sp. BRH_c7a]|nr:MAG: hypothetical protein APF84_05250 [Gracilibacter sp. BRH_c7a]